jgi:hypothetical protein
MYREYTSEDEGKASENQRLCKTEQREKNRKDSRGIELTNQTLLIPPHNHKIAPTASHNS